MALTPTATTTRTDIIWRSLVDGDDSDSESKSTDNKKTLRLAFLGCEVLPPYGPYDHTAELFADLIADAYSVARERSLSNPDTNSTNQVERWDATDLVLDVFGVSQPTQKVDTSTESNNKDNGSADESSPPPPPIPLLARFPSDKEIEAFDGVILPGSFSSAYDTNVPWIGGLADWIQETLVRKAVPTLGVCFGHQLYAHSFSRRDGSDGGNAVRCPSGPQAGQRTTTLTSPGKAFLDVGAGNSDGNGNKSTTTSLDLFYTHGDMVESLPSSRGFSLGGNDAVPIQAALYFSSPTAAEEIDATILRQSRTTTTNSRVMAVTFQAHPEFSGEGGGTYRDILQLMRNNGDVSDEDCVTALDNAEANRDRVGRQSMDAMVAAGRLLGWFPC